MSAIRSCLCLLIALSAVPGGEPAPSWPCWRGPDGSGAAPGGGSFLNDLSKAKLLWESEEKRLPTSYGFIEGGAGGPVAADGRVYVTYQWPSGAPDAAYLEKLRQVDLQRGWLKGHIAELRRQYGMTDEQLLTLKASVDADDVVLCVDLQTGRTLWRQAFAGRTRNVSMSGRSAGLANKTGPHNIPAVAYGKVVAIGGSGDVYCLDATTGKEVWQKPLVPMKPGSRNAGGVVFAGGVFALARGGACIGVDPADGTVRWEVADCLGGACNPVRWLPTGGGEYIVAGGTAIDPRTGTVLWRAPGAVFSGTASAVNGDYLVTPGGSTKNREVGMQGYRITPQAATPAWELPGECGGEGNCAPVIMGGHAYLKNADPANRALARWLCVDLVTGTMKVSASTRNDACAALIGGGGKLYYEMVVIDADPAKLTLTLNEGLVSGDFHPRYAQSHTPCLVGGRLIVRSQTALLCYDVRAP